jgi:hypothetical protein
MKGLGYNIDLDQIVVIGNNKILSKVITLDNLHKDIIEVIILSNDHDNEDEWRNIQKGNKAQIIENMCVAQEDNGK